MRLSLDAQLGEAFRMLTFSIYIAPQAASLVVLSGNQTLQQVNEKFWKVIINFLYFKYYFFKECLYAGK
jgi:E3 ubiquitin-protein ligase RNF1/2